MNMNGSTPGQDGKPFRKRVRGSSRIYGDGRVYVSDGVSVIARKYDYFDFESGEHGDDFDVSSWLGDSVAVGLGGSTSRRAAISALGKIIRKLRQEIKRNKAKKAW